jgi:hypothetical protein
MIHASVEATGVRFCQARVSSLSYQDFDIAAFSVLNSMVLIPTHQEEYADAFEEKYGAQQ